MYPGLRDTPQNKTPPALRPSPHLLPPPTAPAGCGVICGGRRPATAPRTSSGTWGERGGQSGARRGGEPEGEGGRGRSRWGCGCLLSAVSRGCSTGLPGAPRRKGKAPSQPREKPVRPLSPLGARGLPPGCAPPAPTPPHRTMSCMALSSDFSWYSMPCLAHSDFTSGAILCKLCRGIVGKRLGEGPRVSGQGPGRPVCSSPCAHLGGWHAGGVACGRLCVLWGLEVNVKARGQTPSFSEKEVSGPAGAAHGLSVDL